MKSTSRNNSKRRSLLARRFNATRRGTTIVECLVASTLIIAGMATLTTLVIRNGHLHWQLRHHQTALDELRNQIDALHAVSFEQLEMHVTQLQPSSTCLEMLPDAHLTGEVRSHSDARQVVLSLRWKEPGRGENPLRLAAWFYPAKTPTAELTEDDLRTEQATP